MSLHSNEEEEDYGNEEEEDYGSEEEEELVAHTENQRNGRGRTPDRTVNLPSSASDDDDDEEEEEEELVPTHAKNQRNRRGRTPDRVVSTPGSASNKPTTTYQAPKPLAVDLHPALKAPGGASWWLLMVFVGFALGEQVFGFVARVARGVETNTQARQSLLSPKLLSPHEAMQVCEFMTYLAAILIVSVDYPVGKGVAVVGRWTVASLPHPARAAGPGAARGPVGLPRGRVGAGQACGAAELPRPGQPGCDRGRVGGPVFGPSLEAGQRGSACGFEYSILSLHYKLVGWNQVRGNQVRPRGVIGKKFTNISMSLKFASGQEGEAAFAVEEVINIRVDPRPIWCTISTICTRSSESIATPTTSRARTPERRRTPSRSTRVLALLNSPGGSPRREKLSKPAVQDVELAVPLQQHARASWWPVLELIVFALGEEMFARWPEVELALQHQVGPVPRFDFAVQARLVCEVVWHLAVCAIMAADFPPGWGTAVVGLGLWLATVSSDWEQRSLVDLASLVALVTTTLALDKLVEHQNLKALTHCLAAGLALAAVYFGQECKLASIILLVVATKLF
ncbi:hypothetical protein BASA82_000418 [Batrachochytrium salamandrivorans]|nr:hypothetical protein BASA82_000418 [Batrachochytrium salamandrivorans]